MPRPPLPPRHKCPRRNACPFLVRLAYTGSETREKKEAPKTAIFPIDTVDLFMTATEGTRGRGAADESKEDDGGTRVGRRGYVK